MTIDVEDVCTDTDLEVYTLGSANLQTLLPDEWLDEETGLKTAKPARLSSLQKVLNGLKKRRPAILSDQIADPSELKDAICYDALATIYRGAVDYDESPNLVRAKHFMALFESEVSALQPTLIQGVTASSLTFRVSRG